jgi:hypothetical protein
MITNELNLQKELADAQRQSDRSLRILTENGFVLDTSQWLTIKRYAEKYGTNTEHVSILIAKGTIPADCVRDLPEIHNIRIIKDQPYC